MPNNELDYQVLLGTYQRKSADLLAQVIALEARVGQNNNTIDDTNLVLASDEIETKVEAFKEEEGLAVRDTGTDH